MGEFIALCRGNNIFALHILGQNITEEATTRRRKKSTTTHNI